jgi:hypothetical protein
MPIRRVKSEEQQLRMVTVFNDAKLNTLIQSAYQQNSRFAKRAES